MSNNHQIESTPGHELRIEQAEKRTEQANLRTDLANTRTDEANARTAQADLRTEKAEAQTEMFRVSELSYRRLFEAARDGILILDVDTGRISDVNPFLVELLGFSHDEMIGKTVAELSPFKDIVSNQAMLERLQKDGFIRYEDLPLETRDGHRVSVEFVSNVYQAGDKKVIQCNIRDITERKRTEGAMFASEARYRRLFEAAKDGILILNAATGRIVDVNPFLTELLGYARETFIGKHLWELGLFKDIAANAAKFKELQAKDFIRYENLPLETSDGRRVDVEFVSNAYLVDGYRVMQCNIRDITLRKKAEEKAILLAAIVESSDDAIIGQGLDGIIQSWNAGAEKIFGYSAGETVGGPMTLLIPADRTDEENQILDKIKQGDSLLHFETVRQAKGGRRIDVSITISPIKDSTGKLVGTSKVARDITERKLMENALRKTEFQLAHAMSLAQLVAWEYDVASGLFSFSDRFYALHGTTAELEGGNLMSAGDFARKFVHPEDASLVAEEIGNAVATANPDYQKQLECRVLRRNGEILHVLVNISITKDAAGRTVRLNGANQDITERRKLEEQLRQSQKMEAVGQLAGGVAHDFNNILAVISMQAGLLKSAGDLSAGQTELADDIGIAVQRAAALTRQLLLFSRKQTLQLRDLDLNESISGMTKMLARTIGENIAVQLNLAAQPMLLHADAGMMDQVLLNLAVNARDAMLNGGQLVIETAGVEFDEPAATQTAQARPGSFVRLSVSDTGCGIPPENLVRIFEPFFTTKAAGKGTGLGLATIFGIVQQHQGWINVYSEVGHGTTFKIYLPRLSESHDTKINKELPVAALTGHETILLVEDEPALRIMIGKNLTRLGYRVLEAGTGVKALEVWKANHGEIQLLLTDLMMPDGMTGKELAHRIIQENPKLKVVYMSGYSTDIVGKDFPLHEGVNFITKPFQAQKLAQILRERLDLPSL
jgi:PAS domain S-box-containing protein